MALRRVPRRREERRSRAAMRAHADVRPRRGRWAASDRVRGRHGARRGRPQRQHQRHPCVSSPSSFHRSRRAGVRPFFQPTRSSSRAHHALFPDAVPFLLPSRSHLPPLPPQASPAPPRMCTASTSAPGFGVSSRPRARARAPGRRTPRRLSGTWSSSRAASAPPVWRPRICTCWTCRAPRGGTASSSAGPVLGRGTRTSSPLSRSDFSSCTAATTASDRWATRGASTPRTSRTSG